MPPTKRMTANPIKPARYRPGKALAEAQSESESEDDNTPEEEPQRPTKPAPPPKATSFPSEAKRVASNLKNVNLAERRREAEVQERARRAREQAALAEEEDGFVTESSSDMDDESVGGVAVAVDKAAPKSSRPTAQSSGSEDSASEDDSDSSIQSDSAPRLIRPMFIRKEQRKTGTTTADQDEANAADEAKRKRERTDALVQEKLGRDAIARAAGRKNWDDDDPDEVDAVDDTDGLDPELEKQQWVARELARMERSRQALEQREAEIAEVERRKKLSAEEREAEDREHVEKQMEEKRGRGKMAHLQKYHHRGAFYQEDLDKEGVAERDLMGARFVDQSNRGEGVPEYLQVRDATMIGRKGRTRYKDLKTEDTGRWGDFGRDGRGVRRDGGGAIGGFVEDERFKPDFGIAGGGMAGGTGANARSLGERKRPPTEESMVVEAKKARLNSSE